MGLSRHPLLLSPLYARLFVSAFYAGLHLLLTPIWAPRDRGNGGGTRDFRLSQKSELQVNSEHLPAASSGERAFIAKGL